MEEEGGTWKLWGRAFLDYSKALGNKIADGAVIAAQKTKEGAIFVAEKTKEGALFVAEKSKPATDKIREGANYLAEQTKPATDKIQEGASYVGAHVKSAYVNLKCKITGEPPSQPEIQPLNQQEQQQQGDFSEVQNMENNPDPNAQLLNQPFPAQQQPIYTENLDNAQNVNEGNPNFYPNY